MSLYLSVLACILAISLTTDVCMLSCDFQMRQRNYEQVEKVDMDSKVKMLLACCS